MIKQIKLPNGQIHDIAAIYDENENVIKDTYAKKAESLVKAVRYYNVKNADEAKPGKPSFYPASGVNISWNGDTIGKPNIGGEVFKVTDKIFTPEEIRKAQVTITTPETTETLFLSDLEQGWMVESSLYAVGADILLLMVVHELPDELPPELANLGLESGTYFFAAEGTYVSNFSIKNTIQWSDEFSDNQIPGTPYFKVLDEVLDPLSLIGETLTYNLGEGIVNTVITPDNIAITEGMQYIVLEGTTEPIVLILSAPITEGGMTANIGTYFMHIPEDNSGVLSLTFSSEWQDTEPEYEEGTNKKLYYVDCNVYGDGSFVYSDVSVSNGFGAQVVALTEAQIDAICGQSIVNASEVEF